MRYLVDTHVVLWLIGDPQRVPATAQDVLADPEHDLLVSAVSALEVATKVRIGKLQVSGLVESWHRRIGDIGAHQLLMSGEHGLLAGSMAWAHRDPFDRLLVAQAILEGAVLVTVDSAMIGLPAPQVLTW